MEKNSNGVASSGVAFYLFIGTIIIGLVSMIGFLIYSMFN